MALARWPACRGSSGVPSAVGSDQRFARAVVALVRWHDQPGHGQFAQDAPGPGGGQVVGAAAQRTGDPRDDAIGCGDDLQVHAVLRSFGARAGSTARQKRMEAPGGDEVFLVDRLIYQGLRYATSRHAAHDQPVSPHTPLPGCKRFIVPGRSSAEFPHSIGQPPGCTVRDVRVILLPQSRWLFEVVRGPFSWSVTWCHQLMPSSSRAFLIVSQPPPRAYSEHVRGRGKVTHGDECR